MQFERDIIVFLQRFSTPFIDGVFKVMAYCFDYPLVIVLGFVLFLCKKPRAAVCFLLMEGVGATVQVVLKAIISRPRPYVTYPEINNLLQASNSSFPSGHSITCMMAVVMLWVMLSESKMLNKGKLICRLGLILALILCALNRMYLGQHYISDVLAGYVIALAIGMSILKLFYCKRQKKDGGVVVE